MSGIPLSSDDVTTISGVKPSSPIDTATKEAESIVQAFHTDPRDTGDIRDKSKFVKLEQADVTLKFTSEHVGSRFKNNADQIFSTASKITDAVKKELQSDQKTLTSIIDQLHTNIDDGLGIKRYKSKEKITVPGSDPEHKEAVIIRDARGRGEEKDKKDKKPDDLKATYQLSMASTTRGALKMIEMSVNSPEEKDRLRTALMEELQSSFNNLGQKDDSVTPKERLSKVREFEDRLIKKMTDSGIRIEGVKPTELKKMLADTRDMCNLQDTQSHMATVQAVPIKAGTQFGESIETTSLSVRLAPFSDEIVKDLRALREKEFKIKSVPWYNALKEREKKLVRDNIDVLIENRQTLPASLRFLPGLRNAYVEAEYCTTPQYSDNPRTTERYDLAVRTGTPSYTREKHDTTTSKNLSHIEKLSGKKLDILMLNHPFGDEKSICSRMKEAVKSVLQPRKLTHIPLQFRLNMQKAATEIREFTSKIDPKNIGVYFCKSGKDRTEFSRREGRISMLTAHLQKHAGISLDNVQDRVKLRKAMQSSYHGETIAGSYGGSHGALGLKISAVKDRSNGPDIIIAEKNKVASLNKFKEKSFVKKMINSLQKVMPKGASKLQAPAVVASKSTAAPPRR